MLGTERKNEILHFMRFPRAIVGMRTIRLAGTHLLCKGETESEPYANGESDINPDTLTDAHTDPVAVFVVPWLCGMSPAQPARSTANGTNCLQLAHSRPPSCDRC